jgi:type VI secretion system secreted protein VgrG
MPTYLQAERQLTVTTPLAANSLLLIGVRGHEQISGLFRFEFELLAENGTDVSFDKLMGQKVTGRIRLAEKENRYISGIVSRVAQGSRDQTFTSYSLEVVPKIWLLTLRRQSRIFQGLSVPDILKQVLTGMDVTYEIQGTFQPREYCVQYRESDFDFASRLMEEEGIYYFFKHTSSGHVMVLANTPQSHPDSEPAKIIYEEIRGGNRPEERIFQWEKSQQLRSGKTTLWDHSFELPGKHLDATKTIVETVQAGTVSHKFKIANNDKLEIYDYPGGYANRFDGVDSGGGEKASEVQKIFEDNTRTAEIRMQEEATRGILIRGASSCPRLTPGYRFTLDRHFNADGVYVLTAVDHEASLRGDYRSSNGEVNLQYSNSFSCIPHALPFRPPMVTRIPHVQGAQTATVVGPSGEEIFTDKYGRIKVQFPWDRQGKNDGNSSCWLRVATPWAGKQWGMIHIPRIGQEVLVDFMDGNVNDPIVVGSVYNADQMPPYTLPANKTQSGIKTRSSLKGGAANFNEIRFEDKKDSEQLFIHAERNQDIEVEKDETHKVGHDRTKTIENDETTEVKHDRKETVGNNETITIAQNRAVTIKQGNDSLEIKMGNRSTKISLGKSEEEAMQSIELKVGQNSIKIDQTGVTIKGLNITVEGTVKVGVKAPIVQVNADGMLMLKGGITMIN